ncbi:hypothetical protein CHARACLAT_000726 [Characodon lateralis]|uniref:Uncharacterized protein n=1 Tax=Characodon lateralis TaxID=208331 RepID=A0ABU7ESG6_9TELE|nr:hypothetical protein [Characodon lateralis]
MDVLTPVGGDCGKGGVALRGCALLLSLPFFPPSRPSFQPVVWPSQPVARLPHHTQASGIFLPRSLPHLFLSYCSIICLLQFPLTFFSVFHHGLAPVKRVYHRWLSRHIVLSMTHSVRHHFG